MKIFGKGKTKKIKLFNQNKGQKEMIISFLNGLLEAKQPLITFDEIISVTKASFRVLESISKNGSKIKV